MDISEFDVVKAASNATEMVLREPGGMTETDITLLVLGYDSEEVVSAARKFSSKLLSKRNKLLPDQIQQMRMIALAKAAVVGLAETSGPLTVYAEQAGIKDKPPKEKVDLTVPSKEFHTLLEHPGFFFISQQVQGHGNDRGNYFAEAQND
jgi:hypothetical protein